jgi:RNA polymerase sigma-70 factor (ECF subfamily)
MTMASLSRAGRVPVIRGETADPENWVEALSVPGPDRDEALRRVHALLLRAARHQISRLRSLLATVGAERAEEIANQVADEALVVLLAKLPTFEGRSRFTTWAYKFAILQASTEVRRYAWKDREVPLEAGIPVADTDASPEQHAEAADLAAAVRAAIEHALSPHQRSITLALLVEDVPIDVLANRLGTTRNALYKTLHDVRSRLRAHLMAAGYLVDAKTQAGKS